MVTIIDGLRSILGTASFVTSSGAIDYGAMFEYFVGAIILCIVVSSIFKFLYKVGTR